MELVCYNSVYTPFDIYIYYQMIHKVRFNSDYWDMAGLRVEGFCNVFFNKLTYLTFRFLVLGLVPMLLLVILNLRVFSAIAARKSTCR